MSPVRTTQQAPEATQRERAAIDVLVVSLGGTIGLRVADQQLVDGLRRAGLEVRLAQAELPREVRTLMLTDLLQARAAALAARSALREVEPATTIYSSTTAALLWPRPGAIRFDTLAQVTRPGRHGLWQRSRERRRLRESSLLLPWDEASLTGAPEDVLGAERLVVPVSIDSLQFDPDGAVAGSAARDEVERVLGGAQGDGGRVVAVTYAADPVKKGLDRVLAAWAAARRDGERLLVTGLEALPAGYGPAAGVVCAGRTSSAAFRELVGRAGVLLTAPRREDYGIAQLEAIAAGARVVTTAAPGPYAALALLRAGWPQQVVDDAGDAGALAAALRTAIDEPVGAQERIRAAELIAPWRGAGVARLMQEQLAPLLRQAQRRAS